MSDERLVPKLRFDFQQSNFEKHKLDDLVEKVVAGATPKTSIDEYWNGGNIPWLSSGEVHKKYIYFTDKFITSEGYNNSSTKLVPKNSVLIALAGQGKTRGTVAINKIELCTNQSIASIIPNKNLDYKFLFYYLESKYDYLRALSSSDGGRGGLNLKLIRSIPIHIPSIDEQKDISNFIKSIDDKISLLKRKLESYQDFKKYLMQQIFAQKLRGTCEKQTFVGAMIF
ncbi:restriction endonuclease subunit S [Methanobrevibacter sp.]